MLVYVTVFFLSFVAIFLKGFSQQNVVHRRKGLMIPTSVFLATAEMLTAGVFVTNYIQNGILYSISLAVVIGIGGGIGCMMSLDFHSWLTKKIYKWDVK